MACAICNHEEECKCANATIGTKIQTYNKMLANCVGKAMGSPYSVSIVNPLPLNLYDDTITWFTNNLSYITTHWPIQDTGLQEHILRICFQLACKMEKLGGLIMRQIVVRNVITNVGLDALARMLASALTSINNSWKIEDYTPFGLEFMRREAHDFGTFDWSYDFHLRLIDILVFDLREIILEYVPICNCKCCFTENMPLIIGCDILQCGMHLCCECCAGVGCGVCGEYKDELNCMLCTAECSLCAMRVCSACCTDCSECDDKVICLKCTKSSHTVCWNCSRPKKIAKV